MYVCKPGSARRSTCASARLLYIVSSIPPYAHPLHNAPTYCPSLTPMRTVPTYHPYVPPLTIPSAAHISISSLHLSNLSLSLRPCPLHIYPVYLPSPYSPTCHSHPYLQPLPLFLLCIPFSLYFPFSLLCILVGLSVLLSTIPSTIANSDKHRV